MYSTLHLTRQRFQFYYEEQSHPNTSDTEHSASILSCAFKYGKYFYVYKVMSFSHLSRSYELITINRYFTAEGVWRPQTKRSGVVIQPSIYKVSIRYGFKSLTGATNYQEARAAINRSVHLTRERCER